MFLLLSIVLFGLVLMVPAIPSIREVMWPRDEGRLRIPEQYERDPRWFGHSYREKLAGFVAAARGDESYQADLKLRTNEETRWAPDMSIPPGERVRGIAVGERIRVGHGAGIRDAYALQSLDVERDVVARTLTSDGGLHVGRSVSILRWIDADGEIAVDAGANLGVSASGGGRVTLADGVRFERVWGKPVTSRTAATAPFPLAERKDTTFIGAAAIETGKPIIVYGPLRIAAGTTIRSDIKVHGPLDVESGVRISGNVIARGDVTFASEVFVEGHVFSERDVWLGPGCRVGRHAGTKTVYAARHVVIANDVEVEGWVVAEGGGQTK
jgi:predicted acyltransferase (DUF342 family)